ncbi:MAG: DUF2997 domain-containing protein [Pseudomonadota bacterium]
MSEIQEIDVFVAKDGTVKIEVRGVKGKKCLDLTEGVETLLGGRITDRTHTDEFLAEDQELVDEETVRRTGS